jgi:HK97 family phage portal protein
VIVRTFAGVEALTTPQPSWRASSGSVNLYGLNQAYADIYTSQPNVRICVDFLARNIAQLTPHVYRRISNTDRERLADHELARWLGKPNPDRRRYRLFENLIGDMGVYFNGHWLKVRHKDGQGRDAIGLVQIPAAEIEPEGGLLKTGFVWTVNGRSRPFPTSEIVHFDGYNPTNSKKGLSPLETLRNILAEEEAASENREAYWRNAGRMEAVIERPAAAPKWTPEQKRSWREQWQEFSGGGARVGQVPVLEDGMTAKPWSYSAKDSEYTVGGKLRREVVAAAYHIPQPMVGILEHATFSNVKEQHKHLYQDCLGPWLEMIQQEIEGQLLIECEDQDRVYVEFDINAKLAGTPEERASSLQMAVGRPWRTVNEARALENLPRIDDDELDTVAPQQGGPSDATAHPTEKPAPMFTRPGDPDPSDTDNQISAPVLHATRLRQQARLGKLPILDRAATFYEQLDRWNRELAQDLARAGVAGDRATQLATEANTATLTQLLALEAA